ncbi:hypothetical protein C8Q74DRAFT_1369331 [Fomes fomentarius]|nr:hypothetical protein C8Q74DRAFT_1369331 [Fomes fomentarius]
MVLPALSHSMATRTRSTAYAPSWSVAVPFRTGPRPARVIATPEQRTILKHFYARFGDEPTKEDVDEIVKETGLDAKWIRKWVNRERSKHRGRKSSGSNSGSSSAQPTRGSVRMHSPEELQVVSASPASPIQAQATPDVFGLDLASTCFASGPPGPKLTVLPPARAANSAKLSGPGVPGSVAASPVLNNSVSSTGAYTWSGVSSTVPMPTPLTPQMAASGSSFTVPLRAGMPAYPTQAHDIQPSLDPSSFPASVVQYSLPCADAATCAHLAGSSVSQLQSGIPQPPAMSPPPFSADPLLLQAPGGLTASAAYLYQIFNESTAPTSAPPEVAPFNSMFYLTSLTRPEDAVPDLRMPLSIPAQYPVLHAYAHDAMPVSYQMRLSDLVGLARRNASLDSSVSAPTSPPLGPAAQQIEKAPKQDLALNIKTTLAPQYSSPGTGVTSENAKSPQSPAVPRSPEGEDTEDEDEVVTPSAEEQFNPILPSKHLPIGGGKCVSREPVVVDAIIEED